MKINPFKLERYFARYEFTAPYLLSCSDCEPLSLNEILALADYETLSLWNDLKLGYTESLGHPILREEIAKLYQSIKSNQIFVASPEECIYLTMNSLLQKGDHVVVTFPGYQSLYEIANTHECEISRWIPKYNQGWSFDINDFKGLIRDNTKLIVINFPHNPTGATISESDLREIIALAKQRKIVVFSDEMYRFLEYDDKTRISSACDLYENAISLFGMSKSFALAGTRIGWIATKNEEILKKVAFYKDYTTICNSAPSEILAIIALKAKDQLLKRNLRIINQNLGILDDFFHQHKNEFEWKKPVAGPIAFPKLKLNTTIDDFCINLVEKNGVMLLPASVYDFEGNFFRIGFARKNMPEALVQLNKFLS